MLLILDEATSAPDAGNQRRILEAVAALHGRTTILLITHRLATLRGQMSFTSWKADGWWSPVAGMS